MKVAIIPARGGSKRIPRKNIRDFAGKPMIAHSIECARQSGVFDRVIVSTDDAEIGRISREYGAEVPFVRPQALSDDHTGATDVIAHATAWLQERGTNPSAVCCIYATAPFTLPAAIGQGLGMLETGGWQYVFAATAFESPVFRSFHMNRDGGLEMLFPEHFNSRSQDLREVLHDAAQFYWGRPEAWLSRARVFDRHSTVVRIPRWQVQDIDTEEDWLRAEFIAMYLKTVGRSKCADNGTK